MLATVSELHSDQIILSFSDLRLALFRDRFDAVRVAGDVCHFGATSWVPAGYKSCGAGTDSRTQVRHVMSSTSGLVDKFVGHDTKLRLTGKEKTCELPDGNIITAVPDVSIVSSCHSCKFHCLRSLWIPRHVTLTSARALFPPYQGFFFKSLRHRGKCLGVVH